MTQVVIAKEVAEEDFLRFCSAQRIDIDFEDFTEEDIEAFNAHKKKIVKAIARGEMIVNAENEAVFTTSVATLTFKKPKGSSLLAMDRAKKDQNTKAMFEVTGDITGQHASVFSRMDSADVKVCLAVTALFLAS